MNDQEKTREELIAELVALRRQVAEEGASPELKAAATLVHLAPLGIHECDTEGRITFVSQSQEAITGFTAEELVGTYAGDRIAPGPERDSFPTYLKYLVSEQPAPTPYFARNTRKNGEVFDARIDWNYIRNSQGEVTGFVTVVSDVTKQKRAEASLRASEVKYRRLYQSLMDAFVSVDMKGQIQEFNDAYRHMIGYEPDELRALTYIDLTPERWHSLQAKIIEEQVLQRGYSDTYQKEYRRKDGTIFPVELRTYLVTDDDGKPAAMWAIIRDITERKQAEAALKQSHDKLEQKVRDRTASLQGSNERLQREIKERQEVAEALRKSEERYKTLVETSPHAVIMADLERRGSRTHLSERRDFMGVNLWTNYMAGNR